jgi:hypothetical protein
MKLDTDVAVKETCGICRYFENGECHFNPPVPVEHSSNQFPKVSIHQWCGQWAKKVKVAARNVGDATRPWSVWKIK